MARLVRAETKTKENVAGERQIPQKAKIAQPTGQPRHRWRRNRNPVKAVDTEIRLSSKPPFPNAHPLKRMKPNR